MKASTIMFVAFAIAASGCFDAPEDNQARNDLMQAKNAYTKCLQENNADPNKCAGFKEAYEVNLQAYRATSGGGASGITVNYGGNVNSTQPSKASN